MEYIVEMVGCVGLILYWQVYIGSIKVKNPNNQKKFGIIGMICSAMILIIGLTILYYLK
ncbi:hypothetical protein [Anaerorhabdus sp.]|jgi:hypothetical protein|uniref:hypothetical protein n=1 Tax=Anaerorhabdus sp. TaxID=1872524 RepID=UPI002FCB0F76